VQIRLFADADTGTVMPISTHYTVREYILGGHAAPTLKTSTFAEIGPAPLLSRFRRMVEKLRAGWMPNRLLSTRTFVIMAGAIRRPCRAPSFAELLNACQAYKAEAQVDCQSCTQWPCGTWEENSEADPPSFPGPSSPSFPPTCRRIPPYRRSRMPGPPRAWFPALTTQAACRLTGFLDDFQQRGTLAWMALRAQAAQVPGASPVMPHSGRSPVCAPWRSMVSSRLRLGDAVQALG